VVELQHPLTQEVTLSEENQPVDSIDLRNPAGWLLHIRANSPQGLTAKLNELFGNTEDGRSDLTQVLIQSFNPAVIASMAAGQSVAEALGFEPDDLAADAYTALQQGATRAPANSGGSGSGRQSGGGGGGGGGSANKIDTQKVDLDALPGWFVDKLNRQDGCPSCDETEFWDNRSNKRSPKDPDFRCANQGCDAGKGYPFAVWEPDGQRRVGSRRTD